jgi:hypothetical protein
MGRNNYLLAPFTLPFSFFSVCNIVSSPPRKVTREGGGEEGEGMEKYKTDLTGDKEPALDLDLH